MPPTQDDNSWHLDKRVPIALILASLAQFAAIIWWGSGVSHDVLDSQRRIERLERSDDGQTDIIRKVNEQLARIDERLISIQQRIIPQRQ